MTRRRFLSFALVSILGVASVGAWADSPVSAIALTAHPIGTTTSAPIVAPNGVHGYELFANMPKGTAGFPKVTIQLCQVDPVSGSSVIMCPPSASSVILTTSNATPDFVVAPGTAAVTNRRVVDSIGSFGGGAQYVVQAVLVGTNNEAYSVGLTWVP